MVVGKSVHGLGQGGVVHGGDAVVLLGWLQYFDKITEIRFWLSCWLSIDCNKGPDDECAVARVVDDLGDTVLRGVQERDHVEQVVLRGQSRNTVGTSSLCKTEIISNILNISNRNSGVLNLSLKVSL